MLRSSTAKKATNHNSSTRPLPLHHSHSPLGFQLRTAAPSDSERRQQLGTAGQVWEHPTWKHRVPPGSKCGQTTGECPASLSYSSGSASFLSHWQRQPGCLQPNENKEICCLQQNTAYSFFSCSLRKQFKSLVKKKKKKVIGKHQEVGKSEGLLSKRGLSWWATEKQGNLGGGWHHEANKTGAGSAGQAPHFPPRLLLSAGGFSKGLQTHAPNLSRSLQQLPPWS